MVQAGLKAEGLAPMAPDGLFHGPRAAAMAETP
jgi:hypothetical protein